MTKKTDQLVMPRLLKKGMHILALPLSSPLPIEEVFPREIGGSSIEVMDKFGNFIQKEVLFYKHGKFHAGMSFQTLYPLQVVRLNLKRDITLKWDIKISFQNRDEIKEAFPYSAGYNKEKALYLMQLCSLVYDNKKAIKDTLITQYDFDEQFIFSRFSAHLRLIKKNRFNLFYFFFKSRTTVVDLQFMKLIKYEKALGKHIILLVFKGTDEAEDWATNLSSAETTFLGNTNEKVHKGFQDTLKLFLRAVKHNPFKLKSYTYRLDEKILPELNYNTKIILAGHSLGGAIATLTACYFIDKGIQPENLEVYSFGAPPIATQAFANHYQNKFPLYRVVNEFDVIPRLESVSWLFHMGEAIVLPSNDGEVHACDGYIDNLLDSLNS